MTSVFHNSRLVVSTAIATVYTCPSATTAIVFLLQAANVNTQAETATVTWTDASAGNAVTRLGNGVPIPTNEAQGLLTGKLVLEAGDTVRALCSTANMIEVSMSVLEMS